MKDFFLENISEPTSKLGSVLVIINLVHMSPYASSGLPESSTSSTIAFLFDLAPSGVYLAIAVTNNAVRSYHTISPLPQIKRKRRYFFCCTFRELASPRCYLALCPAEPGLSSDAKSYRRLPSQLN